MSILDHLYGHYISKPENTAFRIYRGPAYSYRELVEAAHGTALQLKSGPGANGQVVLIFAPFGFDAIRLFVGTMLAGGIPAFMPLPSERQDPTLFWSHHAALFNHIGEGEVLVPGAMIEQVRTYCPDIPMRVHGLEDFLGQSACPDAGDIPHPAGDATAFLQHSSGTTGVKKGVMLSHAQVAHQIAAYAASLKLDQDSKIVSWLPLYHDMGLIACLVLPLSLGIEVTYLDPFRWVARPHTLFEAIEAHQGSHVWLPNFAFRHLCRTVPIRGKDYDLGSIQAFINCSEPCKDETFEQFAETFERSNVNRGQLTCCYAMAETVFAVCQTQPGQPVTRLEIDADAKGHHGSSVLPTPDTARREWMISSGRPLDGVEFRIVDDDGKIVPEGHCGEIEVQSPFMFSGYYKDAPKTSAALDGDWYKTRDLGFLHGGEVFVIGRTDDLIITNGRNFYAHEIELITSEIPDVIAGRAVAFGHFHEEIASNVLVVIVESKLETGSEAAETLGHKVSQQICDVLNITPHDVVVLPPKTVIKTTSGKTHREANRRRYEAGELKSWA